MNTQSRKRRPQATPKEILTALSAGDLTEYQLKKLLGKEVGEALATLTDNDQIETHRLTFKSRVNVD